MSMKFDEFPDVFATDDMSPEKFFLTEDFWVELEPAMSVQEFEKHEASMVKFQTQQSLGVSKRQAQRGVTFSPGYTDFLVRNIRDWSADMPINRKTVGQLHYKHYVAIADKIEELNEGTPFTQVPGQSSG